ncbi:UNVERIFIED_CONTAM: restriction endonuclease subunit S [Campylobacter lari]
MKNNTVTLREIAIFDKENININNYEFIKYLDTGSITENYITELKYFDCKKNKVPSRAKRKVTDNTIIYSLVRPNQKHYGFIEKADNNLVVSTGFTTINLKDENIDSKYIYCFLTNMATIDKLNSIAIQSTTSYPSITSNDIKNLKIKLPDLNTQKKISNILFKIEQKIKLNNKINDNLV